MLSSAGTIRSAAGDGPGFAIAAPGNVIGEDAPALPRGAPGGRIMFWSGWMGGDDARPEEGVFPPDFRTWSTPGRRRFDDFCDRVRPELEARSLTAIFRPHARHVLSDPQACISLLNARRGQPFALVLDPAGFLTSAMLPRAEDHLTRAFEALAGRAEVLALALTNLEAAPGEPDPLSGPELRARALASGLVRSQLLLDLARAHWPAGRPVLIVDPADAGLLAPTLG
jgi:hypothetical protein